MEVIDFSIFLISFRSPLKIVFYIDTEQSVVHTWCICVCSVHTCVQISYSSGHGVCVRYFVPHKNQEGMLGPEKTVPKVLHIWKELKDK